MKRWWECLSTVCAPGLDFRGFASASSLLPRKSQTLADFQYLLCVLHPDSKLHQLPEQIHQAAYQLSDTAGCLCLPPQQCVPTLPIQLHCRNVPMAPGNAGNASLAQHRAGCVRQCVHPADPGVYPGRWNGAAC